MKDSMELVFDIVKMHALSSASTYPPDFNSSRWISGDKSDQDWLIRAVKKSSIEISLDISFSLWEYGNEKYFVVTGLDEPETLPQGFDAEVMNAGFFTAVVSELELSIRQGISSVYIDQYILSQSASDPLYGGHDFKDLSKVFPDIYFFKISSQYPGAEDNLSQMACLYVASNSQFIPLNYITSTMNQILALIYVNSKILNYNNILQALFSSNFKFAFLDLYRCIELLFQLVYVEETYLKLALSIDKTIFLSAMENELGWKPIERNSIKKIFSLTPQADLSSIIRTIQKLSSKKKEHSDWYYDLRCSIVHLRTSQKVFEINKSGWNDLIGGTCKILRYWYDKFPDFR